MLFPFRACKIVFFLASIPSFYPHCSSYIGKNEDVSVLCFFLFFCRMVADVTVVSHLTGL